MAKQIIFKSKVKRAAGIAKEAWETGIRSIKADVKAETQALISKPFPPASAPLQPPHLRSGRLHAGITVTVEKASRGKAAALLIKSDRVYAPALEFGTRNMIKRPFAQVVLTGGRRKTTMLKKWTDRIARVAKEKTKSSARRTRTGKAR